MDTFRIKFCNLVAALDSASTLYVFLLFIAISTLAIIYLFRFKNKINNDSKTAIKKLEKNGKYIKLLYTEVNEINEELRFFLFQKKWKKRIIRLFNSLFKEDIWKKLNNYFNKNFNISNSLQYTDILDRFKECSNFFSHITMRELTFPQDVGDLDYIAETFGRNITNKVEELTIYCEMASANSTLIVGPAGNGKTNLLCSFAELVMRTGNSCIFIESKEINCPCEDFFQKKLQLPWPLKYELLLPILNFLYRLRKKNIFIIVDAINENDNEDFINSIDFFCDLASKYRLFRVVYSCRSELFEERFNRFFKENAGSILVRNIPTMRHETRAYEHLFRRYKEYFNLAGNISNNVKSQLFKSLILLRIFFEVNKNQTVSINELHSALLFKEYLAQIGGVKYQDFEHLLKKIVTVMIEDCAFDEVRINRLSMPDNDDKSFRELIENNLVLNRKILKNKGLLTEEIFEVLYFPFDELRDYCIARHILLDCESYSSYSKFFEFATQLAEDTLSPTEGVLKFGYFYFRESGHFQCCADILNGFGSTAKLYPPPRGGNFQCLSLAILANCLSDLQPFEKTYIYEITKHYNHDFWLLIKFLISNELDGISPGISILFEIFPNNPFGEFANRLSSLHAHLMLADLEPIQQAINDGYINVSEECRAFLDFFDNFIFKRRI